MRLRFLASSLLLFVSVLTAQTTQKAQISLFTATSQSSNALQVTAPQAYSSGVITISGTLTTVTFTVFGSNDGGVTYAAIPSIAPGGSPQTSQTITTAPVIFYINVAALTHIKITTSGTFTASTPVTFKTTLSSAHGVSMLSTRPTGAAGGDLNCSYPSPCVTGVSGGSLQFTDQPGTGSGHAYIGQSYGTLSFQTEQGNGVYIDNTFRTTIPFSAASIRGAVSTVAGLPSASALGAGAQVVVSDALTTTPGTCTGGGSNYVIAISNGTSWSCR